MAIILSLRDGKFGSKKGVQFGSYVYGIAQHKINDYHRYKNKYVRGEKIFQDLKEYNLGEMSIEENEQKKLLRKLLSSLKTKYQEILYMRYYENLSIDEISKRLNLPKRRVSERIHYALKMLKKENEKKKYLNILMIAYNYIL